jgi:hypothetical protein
MGALVGARTVVADAVEQRLGARGVTRGKRDAAVVVQDGESVLALRSAGTEAAGRSVGAGRSGHVPKRVAGPVSGPTGGGGL